MLRTEFITGGNPPKIGAFQREQIGVSGSSGARGVRPRNASDASALRGRFAGCRGMAKIHHPDPERFESLGYGAFARVPVLFDSAGRYCRAHNRYLRERAELDWHPAGGGDFLRDRTLEKIGECLINFICWCEARSVDFRTAAYKQDVLRYQNEQISGKWSEDGGKLEPSTANQRADEATNFLRWAAEKGLRGPFEIKEFFRTGRSTNFAAQRGAHHAPVKVRAGRAKENPTTKTASLFVLPTADAVAEWLDAVKNRRGYTKYLACRMILDVGARRMEVEGLEVKQWPTAEMIEDARRLAQVYVPMELLETKGGRPRTVRVPLEFAARVRSWIDEKRPTYAYRFFKKHKQKTSRLFLSDHPAADGNPVGAQTVYRCFSEVKPHPKYWSPHKGRHAFACFWVLHALSMESRPHGGLVAMGADWIQHRGMFWLGLLRRQFGHVSEETTEIYLQWLVHASGIAEMAAGWHAFLEGGTDE